LLSTLKQLGTSYSQELSNNRHRLDLYNNDLKALLKQRAKEQFADQPEHVRVIKEKTYEELERDCIEKIVKQKAQIEHLEKRYNDNHENHNHEIPLGENFIYHINKLVDRIVVNEDKMVEFYLKLDINSLCHGDS
jgi:hypothetical protein